MKKLLISVVVIFLLLLSINVQAGQPLGSLRHWIVPPNSEAFGNSLDGWMEAYLRWLENDADPAARMGNVAFLPIICPYTPPPSEPCIFEVEVKPGTAFVLPVATWLGFATDPFIPDEFFGDPDFIYGEATLDGGPVVEINEDYYVGPTDLNPPVFGIVTYYQALACVILPLPPGEHTIELNSYFKNIPPPPDVDDAEFNNIWIITVVP